MRIIAGAWRGRALVAPSGPGTRPTSDRARQALFDMLAHAPWYGAGRLRGARVLDAFAGTGALGLEALSRGAALVTFIERAPDALAALRANIAACGASGQTRVLASDALAPPPGTACDLVFLDPPYGMGLLPVAAAALGRAGWFGQETVLVAENGSKEAVEPLGVRLAERSHGAACITVWRSVRSYGARDVP